MTKFLYQTKVISLSSSRSIVDIPVDVHASLPNGVSSSRLHLHTIDKILFFTSFASIILLTTTVNFETAKLHTL